MKRFIIILLPFILTFLVACEETIDEDVKIPYREFVVLTFDDAPNFPENVEKSLDLLKEYDVPATFFCIGESLRKNPHLATRISKEQQLSNHTMTHADIDTYYEHYLYSKGREEAAQFIQDEVYLAQEVCDSINNANNRPLNKYFRFPYGNGKKFGEDLLKDDFDITWWEVSAEDWDPTISEDYIYEFVTTELYRFAGVPILLFHFGDNSPGGLKRVLEFLKEKNITVLTLEEGRRKHYEMLGN
jgi:peptidoglycan/xylan/chitin deacetylase (PgdA/CDA1 family)